ncbi:MAG: TetR/AcrR family transcriptional regulator [Microthrixaceae bacterium]
MSASRGRQPLRREAIVDAARDLISEVGLGGLTLRGLAEVFGVSAPALYAHFSDKNELLRAVAEQQFEELIRRYEEIDRELGGREPLELIRAQCRHYVDLARRDPELFRVMFLFPPDFGAVGSIPPGSELPVATRALELAIDAVRQAIAAGEIEAEDPTIPAMALWAGAHGVANIFLLDLDLSGEFGGAFIDEVTDRTLRGYGARAESLVP